MSFLIESTAVGQQSTLSFSNILQALLGSLVLYAALNSFYNIYLHPLSRFPGPKLWQTSYIFRHTASIRGTLDVSIKAFHAKYGPVVRYSPDELSFISAEAWKDIYGFREHALPKDPSFYGLIQLSRDKSPSIFTADQDHHPRVRKALSYAFSEKALRDQEPFVKRYVDLLIQRLRGIADAEDNRIDLVEWYNFTTFDIIGDLAIGRSFNCLQGSAYHSWVDAFWKSIKISPYARAMATYTDVQRLLRLFAPRALKEARLRHLQYVGVHTEERLARGILREKPDFISYILRSKGTADELTDGEVEANVNFLLLAGTETTATALSGTTYYLLKNPEVLRKATAEVRSAYNSEDEITFATTAERLPYMQACLTEGLRIYPPGPIAAPRRTPRGAVTWIAGHPVPGGVSVGVHAWTASNSPLNFHRPADFIPERWLSTSTMGRASLFQRDDRAASQPFSAGPRNCLGKAFALNEMRVILARMLWNFDLKMLPQSDGWERQKIFTLWDKGPLMVELRDIRSSLTN
ncbi:hypothetical protein CNMCM5623_008215 [Aspergillus felis]|uniref:Cytochrome P450 monooxygenase n=1 Tax=Aspergillus felis TaxID=1287682 RepID=A0A8H6UU37_9EURO|nr:hypothetical protein CNMCM5623_008215 [Aspergillus felis]KAF7176878.1 hypothetical protein CNMCM7691_004162 [Aspergillus felis]